MADIKDFNHLHLLFPSKYLQAGDLKGKQVTVAIEAIDPRGELQVAGGKSETKPVVRLKGAKKDWVLNKTNAKIIAKLYGNEVTAWIGKHITLYATKVRFGPELVEAIRVAERVPAAKETQPQPNKEPTQ